MQTVGRIKSLAVIGLRLSVSPAHPQFLVSGPLLGSSNTAVGFLAGLAAEWGRVLRTLQITGMPSLHLCCSLDRSKSQTLPTLKGRRLHNDMNTRNWGPLGTVFGSAHHNTNMEQVQKLVHSLRSAEQRCALDGTECSRCFEEPSRRIRSNVPSPLPCH